MIFGTIIGLGDSLTYGSRCELWRGWPIELELLMWAKYKQNWNVVNAGVPGEISIDVYKRAYGVIRSYPEAQELVLLVGTNDAKKKIATPHNRYAEHIEAILRIAQRFDKTSFICTIPELCGFGAPDHFRVGLIEDYNERLVEIAGKWGKELVDLRGLHRDCYADGVHMNNTGYKEIAKRVLQTIENSRSYGG